MASDDRMVLLTATTFGAEVMKIVELEEWWEFGGTEQSRLAFENFLL